MHSEMFFKCWAKKYDLMHFSNLRVLATQYSIFILSTITFPTASIIYSNAQHILISHGIKIEISVLCSHCNFIFSSFFFLLMFCHLSLVPTLHYQNDGLKCAFLLYVISVTWCLSAPLSTISMLQCSLVSVCYSQAKMWFFCTVSRLCSLQVAARIHAKSTSAWLPQYHSWRS